MTMQIIAKTQTSFKGESLANNASSKSSQQKPKKEPEFQSMQNLSTVSGKVKTGVFLSTLAGVSTALVLIMKKQGIAHNLSKIFKTSPKNWGIMKAEYKEKEILKIAAGSIGGGLLGGILLDKKENIKAKLREGLVQSVGNILIPIGFVSGGIGLLKKFKPSVLTGPNTAKNGIIKVAITALSLGSGVLLGNKVANSLSEKIFGAKEERKIKKGDLAPHIDDLCLAATLIAENSVVGKTVSRIIPAALMIAGISTGTAQAAPKTLKQKDVSFSGLRIKPEIISNEMKTCESILFNVHPQVIETGLYAGKAKLESTNFGTSLIQKIFNKKTGALVRENSYIPDGSMLKSVTEYNPKNGNKIKDSFYKERKLVALNDYNKDGNVVKFTAFDENGKMESVMEYNPDNGSVIKDITYLPDGSINAMIEYHPETGDLVKETFRMANGTLKEKKYK